MPDITKCLGEKKDVDGTVSITCLVREDCYRFVCEPSNIQSYSDYMCDDDENYFVFRDDDD